MALSRPSGLQLRMATKGASRTTRRDEEMSVLPRSAAESEHSHSGQKQT